MPLIMTPVTADPQSYERSLQWVTIDKPGLDGYVVVNLSNVSDIALGSSVFYANDSGSVKPKLYRSRNGGMRWEDISITGATLPVTKMAIAPDEAAIIAAATDGGTKLYLSVDGGVTWTNMVFSGAGMIQSLAISKPYGEKNEQRDILVGTAEFGDTLTMGQVWMLHLGSSIPMWYPLHITVDPNLPGCEVSAVAFSPNYTSDQAVLAIASTGSFVTAAYQKRTFLCLGIVNSTTSGESTTWNTMTGYPIEIYDSAYNTQSSGDGSNVKLIEASLALPDSFSATSSTYGSRKLYCFYRVDDTALGSGASNVYRIDDTVGSTVKALTNGASNHRYSSVALSGSTLVAGETDPYNSLTVAVRIAPNCSDTNLSFTYVGYPYGPGNCKLAWYSGKLYCGTGAKPGSPADESGFSVSSDSGSHWLQISLIDTIVKLEDVAVASRPQSIFMTSTDNTGIESLWRSAGDPVGKYWARVLVDNITSDKIITRISPHYRDDYTVYVCEVGQTGVSDNSSLWVSNDRGNSWTKYVAPPGIVDMEVVDKKVSYLALPGGYIARTENGGKYWKNAISSELTDNITMLSLSENNTILVGGSMGDVSYSMDGGKSYTRIPRTLDQNGAVQIIPDSGFKQNKTIYAGCGNSIYRWTMGQSGSWENIRTIPDDDKITGMASINGILYGLWYNTDNTTLGSGSGAERSLAPTLPLGSIEWDSLKAKAGEATFNIDPTSLRYTVTPNSVILWTIDTSYDTYTTYDTSLMMYIDCLAFNGPNLTMADKKAIDCDTTTGRSEEVNFTWGAVCEDTAYQLQIGKDKNFEWRFFDCEDVWPFLVPADVLSPAFAYMGSQSRKLPIFTDNVTLPLLECGHTYYWRIRTRAAASGEIIRSPWSETRSFTTKPGYKVASPYYGPLLLTPKGGCGCSCDGPVSFSWTPVKGATSYKYELSLNPDMSSPLVTTTVSSTAYQYEGQLDCGTSYFWRVRSEQPVLSDWSAVFSFTMLPQEATSSSTDTQAGQTPRWVWVAFGLGGVLILAVAALIMILR